MFFFKFKFDQNQYVKICENILNYLLYFCLNFYHILYYIIFNHYCNYNTFISLLKQNKF